jgi:Tol biopolymer transport system component
MAKTEHFWALAAAAGATLVAVGLLMLMLVVGGVRPAEAAFPGTPGKIAYSGSDGDYEIYTIKPGGAGRVPVTDNTTNDLYPAYAPSGKRIAYEGHDGDDEIYTIKVDGGGKRKVTDNTTSDRFPYWGSR